MSRYHLGMPPTHVPTPAVVIRRATLDDVEAITAIYNEAILTTTATFDTEPKTVAERMQWLQSHDDRYPVWVAERAGRVVGWGSLTKWSDRPAYDVTAETSFYVQDGHRGQGIGRALKEFTVDEARRLGFHSVIARVAEGSEASQHLNLDAGFILVGTLKEVGRKFGKLLDVYMYQKMLD